MLHIFLFYSKSELYYIKGEYLASIGQVSEAVVCYEKSEVPGVIFLWMT